MHTILWVIQFALQCLALWQNGCHCRWNLPAQNKTEFPFLKIALVLTLDLTLECHFSNYPVFTTSVSILR